MQTTLRRLGEDVIGYGIGAGLNRLLGLVVAVIYPLLLSRAEYGSLDVVFSLTALLALVLFLGLEHGLVRFYYEDDDLIRRRRLVSTVFYAVTAVTLGVTAAMLVFSRPLALRLYDDPRYIAFLRIALAGMPFAMVNGVQLLVLRLERRVRAFNLLAAANLALAALIGIGGIVLLDWGAAGVLVGVAVANAAAALAGTAINWRELWHAPQPAALREMVAIGAPLLLAAGAQWVLQYVDRVFLVRMVTADEVGLYAIANGGVGVLALAITAFARAWTPFAFSLLGQERSREVYARTLTLLAVLGGALVAGGALFAREGLRLVSAISGRDWGGAEPAVGPLALAVLLGAMILVVQTGAFIARRTGAVALAMGAAAVVNVALNFALIPRLGITGAALATAAGFLTALAVLYAMAQRLSHIPYDVGKVLAALAFAAAVALLAPHVETGAVWSDLLTKAGMLLALAVGLLAARVVTTDELAAAMAAVRRRLPARARRPHVEAPP